MRGQIVAARSTLAFVFAIGLLMALTMPAAAARATGATVTACTPDSGQSITISITWSGFTANEWDAGYGDKRGNGLGVLIQFDPAVDHGTLSQSFPLPTDPADAVTAAAGVEFAADPNDPFTNTKGPSGSVRRHGKSWPSC